MEVEASGPSFATTCTVAGKAMSVTPALSGLKFEGTPGIGTLGLVVDTAIGGVSCHYEYNSASVTYTPGSSGFKLTNGKPSVVVPAGTCAPGTANGDFAITDTVSGKPLILN